MWGILSLCGGILLRFNPEWFAGASTIGLVLIIFGVAILLLQFVVLGGFASIFKRL